MYMFGVKLKIMASNTSEIELLLQTLQTGTPRAAYQAVQELVRHGKAAEIPVIQLLKQTREPLKLHEMLKILQAIKISETASIDAVIRLLNHSEQSVRGTASQCLLQSSPKLRSHVGSLQAALKREKNTQIKATLHKLIQRYPES